MKFSIQWKVNEKVKFIELVTREKSAILSFKIKKNKKFFFWVNAFKIEKKNTNTVRIIFDKGIPQTSKEHQYYQYPMKF